MESNCPTPEEIRQACEEIRAGWSKAEERSRRVDRRRTGIQIVRVSNLEPQVGDFIHSLGRGWT